MSRRQGPYAATLPQSAHQYLNIRSAFEVILGGGVLAAGVLLLAPDGWKWPLLALLAVLTIVGLVVEIPLINRVIMRHTTYQVDDDAVRIRRGFLISRDIVISTAQILNVTIIEGPLLRHHGLVTVRFLSIDHVEPLGPLDHEEALRLRSRALATYLGTETDGK